MYLPIKPAKCLAYLVWSLTLGPCAPEVGPEELPTQEESPQAAPPAVEDFSWLVGHWQRLGQEDDTETYEIWQRSGPDDLRGHGFILRGTETLWQERMALLKENDQ